MIITINNNIYSSVSRKDIPILQSCLCYQYEKHKFNPFTRKSSREICTESCIGKDGFFYSGFIPRVKKYLNEKNIEYKIIDNSEKMKPTNEPSLNGIKFREDQFKLIKAVNDNQRGVIVSPTGSGKTVIGGGIISCYKKSKTLFLCHTRALTTQAANDFKGYGLKNITFVSDGEKDVSGDIVIATWQSFIKLDIAAISEIFDIVIIDEVHHISDKNITYADILKQLLAPIKVGLTATFPSSEKSVFTIEGLLGEIIGEFTPEEAKEKGIVADTKVIIRKTVFDQRVRDLSKYAQVHKQGIVLSKSFNSQVIREAKYWMKQGNSVLIFFVEIEQGELLKQLADELNLDCELIYGATSKDKRESVKADLKSKNLKCVLSSVIWREGINVPSLNVVINAGGGKSDIAIRQLHGRGTRTCAGKDKLIYVDFFNESHAYLINHFGHRFSIYCDCGWV